MMRLILLLLLVQTFARADQVHQNEVEDCSETVDECDEVEEEECGACHSIFFRECNIKMEYTYTPIKVRECTEQNCNKLGYTRRCTTKYYSQCSTEMVYQEMTEDHPVCGVERQESCKNSTCTMVPVMRCKIEKKTIRKAKPETSCRRIPSQVCRKEKCQPEKCFDRVKMSKEMNPRENCEYKERRVCQETEQKACRTVTRRVCKQIPNPKPCRTENIPQSADRQTYQSENRQTYRQADTQTYQQADHQTHQQADTQTYQQADKQTHQQADKQTHQQADKQTYQPEDKQTFQSINKQSWMSRLTNKLSENKYFSSP